MTHSFAQATPEIGGPGNKNKNSALSGRTLKRSESTGGELRPAARALKEAPALTEEGLRLKGWVVPERDGGRSSSI